VFAAGVGLRRAEVKIVHENPHPAAMDKDADADLRETGLAHPPAEDLVAAQVNEEELSEPAVAAGTMVAEVLSFGDTVERLLEVLLVVLVGVALAVHWEWAAVPLAAALFLLIRPLSAVLLLARTPTTQVQRRLMGWFGIRGIGSLYYVSYALNLGTSGLAESVIVALTVSVVALSVVVHGVSARPVLAWYERLLEVTDEKEGKPSSLVSDYGSSEAR
jgi:NhaP-type Na+/H+ or K+/H+ antiporter